MFHLKSVHISFWKTPTTSTITDHTDPCTIIYEYLSSSVCSKTFPDQRLRNLNSNHIPTSSSLEAVFRQDPRFDRKPRTISSLAEVDAFRPRRRLRVVIVSGTSIRSICFHLSRLQRRTTLPSGG